LVGPAGADGADGAQGPQGIQGIQGPAGADGADGVDGQGVPIGGTAGQLLSKIDGTNYNTIWIDPPSAGTAYLERAISDEDSDLTIGTAKLTFRMPHGMTLTGVRANVKTAPTGANLIIDIQQNGTTIFSTLLSIDAGSKTSVGATTPAVISTATLTDDSEMTIQITQVGSTVAGSGLKILLQGTII